ncbi:MAG: ceramidase domain-containing protein [Shimia sp.]
MDWSEQIDIYCERTDFTFWAEPLNAISNGAFLIAALFMALRLRGTGLGIGWALTAILAAIGVGSFLFHTYATAWASAADVTPIGIFILLYLFAVGWRFLDWPLWGALLLTAAFVPYAAVIVPVLDRIPFVQISNFYWTVPILLVLFAPLVARRNAATARGMLIGAAILVLSICLRSIDLLVCDAIPIGTHYFWHVFNAIMLGWMIEVYRRHMVEGPAARG